MRRHAAATILMLAVLPLSASGESKREQAQKALKTLTTSRNAEDRASAAETLGSLGAPEAVPALAKALVDPDDDVRSNAAYALWELRASAGPARPEIRKALDEETDGRTLLNEIATLEALGVKTDEMVSALKKALRDEDAEVRLDAAKAAGGHLPSERLMRIAIAGMAEGSKVSKTDAAQLMGALQETGDRKLIPVLMDTAERGDARQASEAATLLPLFEPRPPELRPLLIRLLGHRSRDVRWTAAGALSRYMGDAKPALPQLIELLADPDEDVRVSAAGCIDSIELGGADAASAIPALIRAFETTRGAAQRESMARTLGAFGPKARSAAPALRKALDANPEPSLRNQLRGTLAKIDPRP